MQEKLIKLLEQLNNADSAEKRGDILERLSNEEQYHLDAFLCFGLRKEAGTLCFPFQNGKYINDKPTEHAQWIPNRYIDALDVDALLTMEPVEKKDNYRVINNLQPGAERRRIDNVGYINEMYLDLNLGRKMPLKEKKQLLVGVMDWLQGCFQEGKLPRPTTLLSSGRGFAMHYLLDSPIKTGTEEAIRFAALYQCAFDTMESLVAQTEYADSLEVDRYVCRANCLARMAGTKNTKVNRTARFVDVTGRMFSTEELSRAFVTNEEDYRHRVELKFAGKGITKAALVYFYAKMAKELEQEEEGAGKLAPLQIEKIKLASDKMKQYADPEADLSYEEKAKWRHNAKYELGYMNNFFLERSWIDGDGRYQYALIYYAIARTLYRREKAECLLREKVELMKEPLCEDAIETVIDGIEEKIRLSGYGLRFKHETIVEAMRMDEETAFRCGFMKGEKSSRNSQENIDASLERDKEIMRLHEEGMSNRTIAKLVKEEHPEWKVSARTVDRVVKKWAEKDISTATRSIYCTYNSTTRVRQHSHNKENKDVTYSDEDQIDTQLEYLKLLAEAKQNELSVEEDNQFKEYIFSKLQDGNNVMLHGLGGTGKTFLLRNYIEWCNKNNRNVVVLTPTGIASTNYNQAKTIHSFLKIPRGVIVDCNVKKDQLQSLEDVDAIIIDEISMVRCDLFDLIETIIQKAEQRFKKRIQRIYSGDVGQLGCVADGEDCEKLATKYDSINYMFFDAELFPKIEILHIRLDKNRRTYQDESEYAMMLQLLHEREVASIEYFNQRCVTEELRAPEETTVLAGRRNIVDEINGIEIRKHKQDESFTYLKADVGEEAREEEYPVAFKIPVFIGMRVMTVINKRGATYVNGTVGTITDLDLDSGRLKIETDDGKTIYVSKERIPSSCNENECIRQYPIVPAYALTIHKSQGLSLDKAIINPDCFAPGQLYTALSRLRSLEGLYLERPIEASAIKSNPDADAFLDRFNMITAYNYCQGQELN